MSDDSKPKLKSVSNVVPLETITSLDLPAQRVLEAALAAGISKVTIIGEDSNGDFYFDSSIASGPEVAWDLEVAKRKLFAVTGN